MIKNTMSLVLLGLAVFLGACGSPAPGPANSNGAPSSSTQPARPPAPTVPGAVPLPASAYRIEWLSNQIPAEMAAGKDQTISVTFKNAGDAAWPSKATGPGYLNQVSVSYHWLAEKGTDPVVWDGIRSPLPHDAAAGETIAMNNIHVTAPNNPGSYRLAVTLVHDGVGWFDLRGALPLMAPVSVR